ERGGPRCLSPFGNGDWLRGPPRSLSPFPVPPRSAEEPVPLSGATEVRRGARRGACPPFRSHRGAPRSLSPFPEPPRCAEVPVPGTDREFSAGFDHQASATLSFSFPCLFLPDARKTVFNLCLVPPKGYARMETVPRFARARNSDAK